MHLAIVVLLQKNLHKAVDFYQNTLGMKLIMYAERQWAEFDAGGVRIAMCPAEEDAVGGHTGLLFEAPYIEELYKKLKDKQVVVSDVTVVSLGKLITVTDLSGNKFDILEPSLENDGCCKEDAQEDACCKSERITPSSKDSGCC